MLVACILLGRAYINYVDTGYVRFLFYSTLSEGKHPAYFSMYCLTAIILLFQGKFEKWKVIPIVLLVLMVFLLSSRMQILVLLVLAFVKICHEFAKSKKVNHVVIITFIGIISLFLMKIYEIKLGSIMHRRKLDSFFLKTTRTAQEVLFGVSVYRQYKTLHGLDMEMVMSLKS